MLQYLEKLSAISNLAYIRGQVTDQQMTMQLFEWEIASGYDPQLRAFGAQVPTVPRHLELASALQTELAGSPPEHAAFGASRPEPKGRTMAR